MPLQLHVRHAGDGSNERIREIASNGGAELGDQATFAQSIDAGDNRCLHRCGNDLSVGGILEVASVGERHRAGFDERLGHLFDEQRNTFASRDDLFHVQAAQRAAAGHVRDDRLGRLIRQATEVQGPDVRFGPSLPELGTRGDADEHPSVRALVDDQIQQIEGRRIGPVNVFDQEGHRRSPRRGTQPAPDRLECPRPPAARRQILDRLLVCARDGEQRGHQGQKVSVRAPLLPEDAVESGQPRVGRRLTADPFGHVGVQHLDDRCQRRLIGEPRAEALEDLGPGRQH